MQEKTTDITYYANGKFLLTGEYAVLDNVSALAMPLKLQQKLTVRPLDGQQVSWMSYDDSGELWFSLETTLSIFLGDYSYEDPVANKLSQIIKKAIQLNANARFNNGFAATTHLDFNRLSGMGTSSTLIYLVSQWLGCDPYKLQFACFGGSGYDIACAMSDRPIIYNYTTGQPTFKVVDFNPKIKDQLFFVYLNTKQNSRESIARFDGQLLTSHVRSVLNDMPSRFVDASSDLKLWDAVVHEHEAIIARLVSLSPVKERLFNDYKGSIKSLGGWGGDYVLASGGPDQRDYFKALGYTTILEWDAVVKSTL